MVGLHWDRFRLIGHSSTFGLQHDTPSTRLALNGGIYVHQGKRNIYKVDPDRRMLNNYRSAAEQIFGNSRVFLDKHPLGFSWHWLIVNAWCRPKDTWTDRDTIDGILEFVMILQL